MRKNIILAFAAIVLAVFCASAVCAEGVDAADDVELISRAVAASYPDEELGAKVGICAVILNRVETEGFPDSVAGVISARGSGLDCTKIAGVWSEDGLNEERAKKLRECRDACLAAMSGADPTGGALYFESLPKPSRGDNRPDFDKSIDVSKYSTVIGGVGFY